MSAQSTRSEMSIYALVSEVVASVRTYDRTTDHLRHGPGDDCIRCALVAALPPYAQALVRASLTGGGS